MSNSICPPYATDKEVAVALEIFDEIQSIDVALLKIEERIEDLLKDHGDFANPDDLLKAALRYFTSAAEHIGGAKFYFSERLDAGDSR
jgi:hypothetical protein